MPGTLLTELQILSHLIFVKWDKAPLFIHPFFYRWENRNTRKCFAFSHTCRREYPVHLILRPGFQLPHVCLSHCSPLLALCSYALLSDFLPLCPLFQPVHILVLLLAGIPIGILLKVIFYITWTFSGPPLYFIFIFLKLYILMKLLYFMFVPSIGGEIYREIKWSCIHCFYPNTRICLGHINKLIKRMFIDLMEKRECKKKKEMKELIWVLNNGVLSQKCMHLNSSFTHSLDIKVLNLP